ncbi:flagellar hook-associated protein FlgK [Massilia horti]|uniref:Flagellar hook-associated protein 1 n=1 Tax=Massilia horti TaxID=2562153 RepID=A0A4Y9SY99_9BURK|nr:flagellar hook-associated protein FlgK [Massilia horti]TFW29706.1 flagellar hook-associated protein FlgK [Massilia horti]
MTIINNALSGALAAQVALSASSQNIANLQTKGYTRQAALLTAVGPDAGKRSAGNGVQASSLIRFSDGYKSQQLWRAASDLGARSQTQPYLTQLEQVMGDETSNLSSGIDKFFQSLNALAGVDPSSTPLRQQVLTAAGQMAQRFNSLGNVFNGQLQSVHQQRGAIVDSANAAIATIAALNLKISHANATGDSISALIDARDNAIDELASKMALEVSDQPDGTRNVSLKTGQSLVIGGVAGQLTAKGGLGNQTFDLQFASTSFAVDAASLGGQLGGLSTYERDVLLPLQQGVADIAEKLADKVNTVLMAGSKMDGTPGKALLVFNPGGGSNMLQVAALFQTDDLALSADGTPGDSGNLQALVAIKGQSINVTNLGNVLIGDADTQLVGRLGVDSQLNQAALGTAETVRSQAIQDWQATSGVNQDEEAVNLVEYQKMYQANMKVVAVAMALFDATLQIM